MRCVFCRVVLLCAVLFSLNPLIRADLYTFTASQALSGNWYTSPTPIPFQNMVITFHATITTEDLVSFADCVAQGFCEPHYYSFQNGLTGTWTVGDFGTFEANIPYIFFSYEGSPYNPQNLILFQAGDQEDHGAIPNPVLPDPIGGGEPCDAIPPCPVQIDTLGGVIELTGIDGPGMTSVTVTPEGAVPEPSTLALFTSGLSAVWARRLVIRRREIHHR